tara:strand:+ start:2704 stop:2862 length:159 start_codon:yes stop_codon:yes gene_type:complete
VAVIEKDEFISLLLMRLEELEARVQKLESENRLLKEHLVVKNSVLKKMCISV